MTINTKNVALMSDSYKQGHWKMLRPEPRITSIFSYLESRVGAKYPYTIFFGLQYLLKEYFEGVVITQADVEAADALCTAHLGPGSFNRVGWDRIVNVHGGRLPLRIDAAPEGTKIPVGNVMLTVESTDPELSFLTNFVETQLMRLWYPSNVATISHYTREMLKRYMDETADSSDGVAFMLHDFGARSATGHEAAGIGGMAHLASGALGTDTMEGMLFAIKYYGADMFNLAFSVPASEHSIMSQSGPEGEYAVLDHLLDTFPSGILSVVSDTYDIYEFVREVGARANRIKARDGIFVVRPDSVTEKHLTPSAVVGALLEMLDEDFGSEENTKGYKLLNSVRVLYGDGVDFNDIEACVRAAISLGYSAENLVFGQGGHLLQAHTRDTQRNAIKASDMVIDGVHTDVFKRPSGDLSKASKAGRFALIEREGKLITINDPYHPDNILQTVFLNGELKNEITFEQVRANAALPTNAGVKV